MLSERILVITLLIFISSMGFAQNQSSSTFDQAVLERVKTHTRDGEITDPEKLFKEVASDPKIKGWLNAGTLSSVQWLNKATNRYLSEAKVNLMSSANNANRVFLSKGFFDSIPPPELALNESTTSYKASNAVLVDDLEVYREEFGEIFEKAGINGLFQYNKIPGEDKDETERMFLKPSINKNQKLIRPLYDQAMAFEKRHNLNFSELSGAEEELKKELLTMENSVASWSSKAEYYPLSQEDMESEQAKASLPYKHARAILMRLCQQRVYDLHVRIWREKLANLTRLSENTAKIFLKVDWNSLAAKRSDLNNPLIQMAQRSQTIRSRLDMLIFNAGLIQDLAKTSDKFYQKALTEPFW